jgi:hypothetical protein
MEMYFDFRYWKVLSNNTALFSMKHVIIIFYFIFNISSEEIMHIIIYFHNLNFIAGMMKISVIEYVTLTKLCKDKF